MNILKKVLYLLNWEKMLTLQECNLLGIPEYVRRMANLEPFRLYFCKSIMLPVFLTRCSIYLLSESSTVDLIANKTLSKAFKWTDGEMVNKSFIHNHLCSRVTSFTALCHAKYSFIWNTSEEHPSY